MQPRLESLVTNREAGGLEECKHLMHIMVIQQHLGEYLAAQVQVVDVGAAVVPAGMARATRNL